MPPLSMLIKPASGNCNLRCQYCFYHSLTDSRQVKNYGYMSLDTLETIVKKALEFADGYCSFAFQGGEPTLAGLSFYETLIGYQKKYNTKNVKIHNAIQTNGMLTDQSWADFFVNHHFLVGLSLDGNKDLHDQNRLSSDERGSFHTVMKTVDRFNQSGVSYNILCVITKGTAKHAQQVYQFFKKNKFRYLQFIPCLDALERPRGEHPYSLTPQSYLLFLKTMLDLWARDLQSGNPVHIRYFSNLLDMLHGRPAEACGMSGICSCQFVIEADGSVYPCDFYATDRWLIGNIGENGFEEMRYGPVCLRFIEESEALHADCRQCQWRPLCRGGCRRDREPLLQTGGKNYFCESYRAFFEYALPKLKELATV